MADPPASQPSASPISKLLQTLGMTREDLVLHTEQMRALLSQGDPPEPEPPSSHNTRSLRRSRTVSLSNLPKTRFPSPPRTPVKPEPVDVSIPAQQMDTMQVVIERKRKQSKKEQNESSSQSRDTRRVFAVNTATPTRVSSPQLSPQTPHHYKYYSERVIGEASSSQLSLDSFDDSNLPRTPSRPSGQLKEPSSRMGPLPKTPVTRHIYSHASSSRASTPCSSPAPIVNIVSSPGPMRPDDEEDDENDLPYSLPPGPYFTTKPDYSYAALIGQAILSSPEHRLTLQDIYEWITTVYPFYTRGEQTWMNSVRHSLSTMAVFRKVPRGRNEGKSLWAIWDCDIPCFASGGFRKSLCADMVKAKPPAKSGPKRKTMEETLATRESKRRKKATRDEADANDRSMAAPPLFNGPILPPFYTPVYPNAQQQPYYTNYVAQPLPAEVIFPPLPAHSAYHRLNISGNASRAASVDPTAEASTSTSSITIKTEDLSSATLLYPDDTPPNSKTSPKAPSSSSSGSSSKSLPALTPNCSSSSASSPPLSSEPSQSSIEGDNATVLSAAPAVDEDEVDRLTAQWLASPSVLEAFAGPSPKDTSNKSSVKRRYPKNSAFAFPQSPTPKSRVAANKPMSGKRSPSPDIVFPPPTFRSRPRMTTPPPHPRPCTPPRKRPAPATSIQLSAQHTPISHRGLHMSPSSRASLAHYKSNLDPPPPAIFKSASRAPLLLGVTGVDDPSLTLPSPELTRTPSRKRTSPQDRGSGSGSRSRLGLSPSTSLTPQRLFAPPSEESPYRSSSRAILDPHDPSALIDEEVQRLGSQSQLGDSPTGFFGKRSILYESPSVPDPARWDRYW